MVWDRLVFDVFLGFKFGIESLIGFGVMVGLGGVLGFGFRLLFGFGCCATWV